MIRLDPIRLLIKEHAKRLRTNPYCYFELAYTRQTDWMAWICSTSGRSNPDRTVITSGQGRTPDMACRDALRKLKEPKP